ncbi:hypothetical protein VMCG_10277 [Cytospora schulzeri]|uniref:Uncharacterized protein n=1 Tax=Cytospora schulzeri TaxID=448051 RepID=A0A423VAE5_9PEZI|nr:hypothetical protein VMCG_10277 [Valsa malicola]
MSSLDIIDVSAQQAIATWTADSQGCCRLDSLKFHIFHDPSANTAFFKLRAPVTFQTTATNAKKTTAVWLFLAPERIATLALQRDEIDEATRKQLGPNAVCLRFDLKRPATLVLPPDIDLNCKEQSNSETIVALRSLARATNLAISVSLSGRILSHAHLQSLCTAASTGSNCAALPSTSVTLVSSKHAADTVSLYGGKGGKVIEGDSPSLLVMTRDEVSPPPYADIGASPPSMPASWPEKKRRRRASSDAGPDPSRQHFGKSIELKMALEEIKISLRSELKQDLKSELRAELKTELKHELRAELKDELRAELRNELMQEVEARVFKRVEECLQEQADDFETQLYDVRHEIGSTVYSEVEDQTYAARQELEEFVKDEMDEAQTRFSMSGLLFVTAPRADHKLINRILVYLKDWEYESGDRFKLVTSKSVQALGEEPYKDGSSAIMKPTSAPVAPDLANEWAGASIADVEAFCVDLDKSGIKGLNKHLFVALDADGAGEDKNCVLAERVIDCDAEPIQYPELFNKARVPWYQTYLTWTNLDISNIGWDEMMSEDADEGHEGGI